MTFDYRALIKRRKRGYNDFVERPVWRLALSYIRTNDKILDIGGGGCIK